MRGPIFCYRLNCHVIFKIAYLKWFVWGEKQNQKLEKLQFNLSKNCLLELQWWFFCVLCGFLADCLLPLSKFQRNSGTITLWKCNKSTRKPHRAQKNHHWSSGKCVFKKTCLSLNCKDTMIVESDVRKGLKNNIITDCCLLQLLHSLLNHSYHWLTGYLEY